MTAYEHSPHARVRLRRVPRRRGRRSLRAVEAQRRQAARRGPLRHVRQAHPDADQGPAARARDVRGVPLAGEDLGLAALPAPALPLRREEHARADHDARARRAAAKARTAQASTGTWRSQNEVTYVAQDDHLQEHPVGERQAPRRSGDRVLPRTEKTVDAGDLATMKKHTMDCIDCHNRPAHNFETPDVAVDRALAAGVISSTLPWVKSLSVETLSKEYPTRAARRTTASRRTSRLLRREVPGRRDGARGRHRQARRGSDRHLRPQRVPRDEGELEDVPVEHRPPQLARLLPLPRRQARLGRRQRAHRPECKACHTEPQRGPQSGMGEAMAGAEKDWHPWQTAEKHLERRAAQEDPVLRVPPRRPPAEDGVQRVP